MSENWSASGRADNRSSTEVIRERVEMLAAVFSKKTTAELIVVWEQSLKEYPVSALKAAFTKAERNLERFPTPKTMRALCNENMPSQAWRYDFQPALKNDPETGKPVRVLIDPDPTCRNCRSPRSQHPYRKLTESGDLKLICETYIGEKEDRMMYRPQDCPEGREFLRVLKAFKPKAGEAGGRA